MVAQGVGRTIRATSFGTPPATISSPPASVTGLLPGLVTTTSYRPAGALVN